MQLDQKRPGGISPLDDEGSWASYVKGLRKDESRENNSASAKDSSALGPDQFLSSTWLEFAQDEPWAQGKTRDEILAMRTDPQKSEDVLKQFTAYNRNVMEDELDRKVNGEELRVAHFLGADDAVKVLKANPSLNVDRFVGAAKGLEPNATNFRMFYKGMEKGADGKQGKPIPKTVAEFLEQFGVS